MRIIMNYIGVPITIIALSFTTTFAQGGVEIPGNKPPHIGHSAGVPEVIEGLNRNHDAIINVPQDVVDRMLEEPQPNVKCDNMSKVWIGQHNDRNEPYTVIYILNPSNETIHVSCNFFDNHGTIQLDYSKTITVSRGAMGFCRGWIDETYKNGWVLISGDIPVIPFGTSEAYAGDGHVFGMSNRTLAFHPIDCTDPTGKEFICQFVRDDLP